MTKEGKNYMEEKMKGVHYIIYNVFLIFFNNDKRRKI